MNPDVSKAAEKLAKLRAQADKYATPLAEAQVALEAAQEAEAARQAERAAEYDRATVRAWRDDAAEASAAGNELHSRFKELLAEEPWFVAYVAHRAERYKREKIIHAAQRAQSALGDAPTIAEQRWYDLRIVEDIISEAEAQAAEIGADYAEELETKRTVYIEGTD